MLYSIKLVKDLENLHELELLQDQVKEVRLQDKLGEQNYHQNVKQLYESLTDIIKDVS